MTREEALKILQREKDCVQQAIQTAVDGQGYVSPDGMIRAEDYVEACAAALSALRLVSREQVERIRGEWVAKHRHWGGFRRVTGVDDMGERRTITIDERCEYDDRYCSKCGKRSLYNFLNFCGYCGAPMTDEAMEMVMERWKGVDE